MDVYDESFLTMWRLFSKNKVRYVMVGGFATNLHGYQRYTGDIDIFIDDTIANRQHLRKAFKELGMGDIESMETMQFVPGWVDFVLNNGVRLDVMTALKGVDISFDECLQMAPVVRSKTSWFPSCTLTTCWRTRKR